MSKYLNMSIYKIVYQNIINSNIDSLIDQSLCKSINKYLLINYNLSLQKIKKLMRSSHHESSSDNHSVGSYKESYTSRFLRSITHNLLKQMKKYLQKNKRIYQLKEKNKQKIQLYEDIFFIVALKENQQQVFEKKKDKKQIIAKVANQLGRKYVTIYDRLRKKLNRLNNQQLYYLMENNKSLAFRYNTNQIIQGFWPPHLRTDKRQQISDDDNVINLESSQQSNYSHISHKSSKSGKKQANQPKSNSNDTKEFVNRLQSKRNDKKINVIREVENIMSESQSEQSSKQSKKDIDKKEQTDKHIYNLQDPIQKEIFLGNIIIEWKNKNLSNTYFESKRVLQESKICYNFVQREYMFVNPQVMKSVWNNLNQQCLINVIRSKQKSEKKRDVSHQRRVQREKKRDDRQKDTGQLIVEDVYEGSNRCERDEDVMRCRNDGKSKSNRNNNQQSHDNQINNNKNKYKSSEKRASFISKNHNHSPILQVPSIQEASQRQSFHRNKQNNTIITSKKIPSQTRQNQTSRISNPIQSVIKDPIKMLEKILTNCDVKSLTKQMNQMIQKGLQLSQKLKKQTLKSMIKQDRQKLYQQNLSKQKQQEDNRKNELWFDLSSQQQEQQQQQRQKQQRNNSQRQDSPQQQQESKPMVYWFNNQKQLYECYQNNPYQTGYLLWTEEQDELLCNAHQNIQQYSDQFQALIDEKTPSYLIQRMTFINIPPNSKLFTIAKTFL